MSRYVNSIQLRKIKQYLLSKYYITKVKELEEIRIIFIIGTPQVFIDISFKILMRNINLIITTEIHVILHLFWYVYFLNLWQFLKGK